MKKKKTPLQRSSVQESLKMKVKADPLSLHNKYKWFAVVIQSKWKEEVIFMTTITLILTVAALIIIGATVITMRKK